MKTYNVYLNFNGCIALEVEGENKTDAIETAYNAIEEIDFNSVAMNWCEDVEEKN